MSLHSTHVLREYAVVADGWRGIVIGPRGDIAWMCHPRWDSDAVFSSLVGGPGVYSVTPYDSEYVWGGSYETGSLIWTSRWVTTAGVVECREALGYPGDPHRAVILRRLRCVEGRVRVRVVLDVRAGFGARTMTDLAKDGPVWTGTSGELRLRWSGADDATRRDGRLVMFFDLAAGDQYDLVLELSDRALPGEGVHPDQAWDETANAWSAAVPEFRTSVAPRDSQHAYAVLRGLTRPGGGMVAAVTTSLPERADAGTSFDYRYSWIRDQCFAGQAVAADGAHPVLDDAVAFVSQRLLEDGPDLSPAYDVEGGSIAKQRKLDLPGYPGGEVRIGNWVRRQFQLDAFGEALLLLAAGAGHDRLDVPEWRAVEAAVSAIEQRWGDQGAGIWETHADHWTHSRLICVAGLRSISAHAPLRQAATWNALADRILSETSATSLHPEGRWQRSPTDARVDASLLLPGLRGATPADDPRHLATLAAVEDELSEDHFLYRFRHDDRPLHMSEGAFLVCGFHMALALHQQGQETRAARWFERNRSACGSPGLFTEEFDIVQRQLRGNLPQAFVHGLMFETGRRLADPATPSA